MTTMTTTDDDGVLFALYITHISVSDPINYSHSKKKIKIQEMKHTRLEYPHPQLTAHTAIYLETHAFEMAE